MPLVLRFEMWSDLLLRPLLMCRQNLIATTYLSAASILPTARRQHSVRLTTLPTGAYGGISV